MDTDKKILVVLGELGIAYYNNYIMTSALNGIKSNCFFIAPKELADRDFNGISKDKIFWYNYPRKKHLWHRHLFNINTWKHRAKSGSFRSRFSRLKPRQQIIYKILALPILYPLVRFVFLSRAHDEPLARLIKNIGPDIILIPSSAYEGVTFEIIKIARRMHVPTCLLIDNWDNISGKTIFTRMPDYLCVWSQQGAEHAHKIRGMPKERIFIIGTPRFAEHFKEKDKNSPSPYPFKYVLFAGSTARFDELGALRRLDAAIQKNGYDIKIVYRPHPNAEGRLCADTFFEYDFQHVVLDTPARLYYKRDFKSNFVPELAFDLSYLPKLLSNMEFMICCLSSMIIEGLIFDKKVAVPVYDDGIHGTNLRGMGSPHAMFFAYEHFRGIERLKNIRMIYEINDLEKVFSDEKNPTPPEKIIDLDYFISKETANYPNNLRRVVNAILDEPSPHGHKLAEKRASLL